MADWGRQEQLGKITLVLLIQSNLPTYTALIDNKDNNRPNTEAGL